MKRQERLKVETAEAEQKFLEEHKEEIEIAVAFANRDPVTEEEEGEKEVPPVMPVFNVEEFVNKWLIENPVIQIPDQIVDDIDNDWVLTQQEIDYHVNAYFTKE